MHYSDSLGKETTEVDGDQQLEACQATLVLHFCCLEKMASDNDKLLHNIKEKRGCCDALMESIRKEKAGSATNHQVMHILLASGAKC